MPLIGRRTGLKYHGARPRSSRDESRGCSGGSGKSVPRDLAREAKSRAPLWLAGGIGADNVGEVLRELRPELLDASSRLEESAGRKDRGKLARYFEEIERNADI